MSSKPKLIDLASFDNLAHAVSGAAASALAMSVFYPLDQLRTVAQVESDETKGDTQLLTEILQRDGVGGLYKGLAPVVGALSISNFVYFYFYNGLKLFAVDGQGRVSTGRNLLIAAMAGAVNVMITCPLWVATTRLKLQQKNAVVADEKPYRGLFNTVARIAREEGLICLIVCYVFIYFNNILGVPSLWSGLGASLLLVSNPTIQVNLLYS
jgi:adenine nucleotide transporter 17